MVFQAEDGYRKSVHHEVAGLDTMKSAGSNLKCMRSIIINIITFEPHYMELSYLKVPVILNRKGFPLDLPLFVLFFQSITMHLEPPLSRTIVYLNT